MLETETVLARPTTTLNHRLQRRVERLLASADVRINGPRPWDLQVHNDDFYRRVLLYGTLGLGESYMDGWWDCEQLDAFVARVLRANLKQQVRSWMDVLDRLRTTAFNLQKKSRAFQVGEYHYDIGNDLYERMLDGRMTYSSGYWKNAATLDEAQEAKLDLVCRKLDLEEGMRVLDTGCGWGGAGQYAAERYGVEAVGITVSKEQARLARERCRGLPVEIRLQDYRDLRGERFDRIFSIGMIEHVGYKNYRTFMEVVHRCLPDDGLFLLHCIGSNRSSTKTDLWTRRYIFPNSMTPSARQLTDAVEGLFIPEDWQNFGPDYDPTLMAWHANFTRHWSELEGRRPQYDERFYRMWTYYLLSCAGAFRARSNQLWQLVLSPRGTTGRYDAPR